MSLDYVSLSSNILNTYTTQKNNLIQDNLKQTPYPAVVGTEWMDGYIQNYDSDANSGVMSALSIIMQSTPELLRFNNTGSTCRGDDMMGAKLADYWSSQLTIAPGIASVSNDASKIRVPIENYLCSQTSVESTNYYEHLFIFIENQVKSIIWTVTTTALVTYTATIS